jgi:hypothetical protein
VISWRDQLALFALRWSGCTHQATQQRLLARDSSVPGAGALRCPRHRLPLHAVIQQQLDADGLPPLAPPDASDDERATAIVARMVARHGAPSIEDYRRVYEQSGAPWPGDEEIRRRHPVAPAA